ncbi:1-deoxy-D-xylulose-5-phosphate reductoisomerase [Caldisericum exile]|uniref:1-deoxy-D-xylulose 5-phosphate reductoisomerase n=1 Tax=Caldisericum exile (strain DSM 21853 / NBRC 104410 / AZM16c01) TaxID=511051 RepID=A0A7U6GEK5_CALEA|nr:1-deoxy-D-xylulose-5-phosphate reductoisomerase [Caldisericum exile]BAL80936.1 1-deoxy-D-xylulose 5-phosphate reductoisomerase [Caldisericum exile AZM16c01]
MESKDKRVVIFGSTGILGKKAFDLATKLGYTIVGLTALKNFEEINKQIQIAKPLFVSLDTQFIEKVEPTATKVCSFENVHECVLESNPDIVLFLAAGISSAKSIKVCLDNGVRIGIANKESIIAFGEILFENKEFSNQIIPIDSETNAVFQLLLGEEKNFIEKIHITASGGPFFGYSRDYLKNVTVSNVLRHPNWKMGKKITVDSANLINKAFEIIETHFLFNVPYSKIDALVQRESVIHAMVEFIDGEIKGLLSKPDMSLPIQYALTYPERAISRLQKTDLVSLGKLTFFEIDRKTFPLFDIVLNYAMLGGNYLPSIVAADEVLVEKFIEGEISFLDIEKFLIEFLSTVKYKKIESFDEVEYVYFESKNKISELLRRRT